MAVSLAALREKIRVIEGAPRVVRQRVSSGVPELDALISGLPCPGILEIHGPNGGGKNTIASALVAHHTNNQRWVAWVDPLGELYPPGLLEAKVALHRLLIIRPPEDGSRPWVWTTEQLLRSGNFAVVILDHPPRCGRTTAGHQWARAAEVGGCTAVVLSEKPIRTLPADVRLAVGHQKITVVRDRQGGPQQRSRALEQPISEHWSVV